MKPYNLHKTTYSIALMAVFIWIGFVCSISFMEAWLKFRAPNVTLSIGLGIGQLIFAALNRVEWVFAMLLVIFTLARKRKSEFKTSFFLYLATIILMIQTFLLLPMLNERAEAITQGMTVSPSFTHFYYLFLEIVKVASLFVLGTKMVAHLPEQQCVD